MTKNEARAVLKWSSHPFQRAIRLHSCKYRPYEDAITALCEPPSIAQSIRDAAINWPCYLGDVESNVIDSFLSHREIPGLLLFCSEETNIKSRTFMLLV